MAIPLSYNFRNLMVRKTTTVMTSAGIMLSVAVLVASLALVNGLRTVFANTGHPLQVLVLRNGGTSELGSLIPTDSFEILRSKAGVAIDGRGEALVSPELVNVANLPSVDNPKGMNITVRGINPIGIEMRSVRLTDGRWFRSGQRESSSASQSPSDIRLPNLEAGSASAKATGRSLASRTAENRLLIARSGATSIRSPQITTGRTLPVLSWCAQPTQSHSTRSSTPLKTIVD